MKNNANLVFQIPELPESVCEVLAEILHRKKVSVEVGWSGITQLSFRDMERALFGATKNIKCMHFACAIANACIKVATPEQLKILKPFKNKLCKAARAANREVEKEARKANKPTWARRRLFKDRYTGSFVPA